MKLNVHTELRQQINQEPEISNIASQRALWYFKYFLIYYRCKSLT
jgi:hypothetical protein